MKTRAWLLILAAILGISLFSILRARHAPPMVAGIYVDGECLRRVDLNRVKAEERYTIENNGGSNTILIQPGRICVEEADCPDKVCVMEGWLPEFGFPIVCLPHGLLIQLEEDSP